MITAQQALKALRTAVNDYGEDWVDPNAGDQGCVYTYDHGGTKRHCLAGRALMEINPDYVPGVDHELNADIGLEDLLDELHIEIEEEAATLLSSAQSHQDDGKPWGVAVDQAVAYCETVWAWSPEEEL